MLSQVTSSPGELRDRYPQTGNYDAPVECHWQLTTPDSSTVVQLTFDFINLNQYRSSSNDVLLMNLGSTATVPQGWRSYQRLQNTTGSDSVGSWDYTTTQTTTNVCAATVFDPRTMPLTQSSPLDDRTRQSTWIYYTGQYSDLNNAMTLTSNAQDVYVIFRSFAKYSTPPSDNLYGFQIQYSFVKLCNSECILFRSISGIPYSSLAEFIQCFAYLPDPGQCSGLVSDRFELLLVGISDSPEWINQTGV
ncbi:hypothetical protein AC1031_005872 [Aphanomyces cochlioides]|nr:hypothetical protein AC1031_005872 [Aphanomyces cochlioides]